jgi:LPS O-antigen subunit length determinant protein (WzzB/FepE family)
MKDAVDVLNARVKELEDKIERLRPDAEAWNAWKWILSKPENQALKKENEQLHNAIASLEEEIRNRAAEKEQLKSKQTAEIERLHEALSIAKESIIEWGAYASAYFQEKHDLAGDIAAVDAAMEGE